MPDFTVELQQLRDDATTFEAGGQSLANMAATVQGWGANVPDWGIMSDAQGPFTTLAGRVSDYCTDGNTEMTAVGENLRHVADVYEAEEEAGVHAANDLY